MCITDKAKETSSCADLFRCGAASVCLDCRMFALRLGVSVSLIRLPRCCYYTTCKWCMVSHLSSDAGVLLALVPWLPCAVRAARVAAGCVREPGLAVCPASWPACVPVAWCCGAVLCPAPWCVGLLCLPCGPAMPALWAELVRGPCLWASYKPLLYGPILRPCISGLIWASEKALYFRLVFSAMYFCAFSGLCFRLKISGQIFRASKAGFFLRIFSRRFFRRKFPGYFFRVLFSGIFPGLIFAAVSGFLFFLDVIFTRFPVLRDKFFHVVKFQELVHGGLVDSVALAF